MRQICIFAFREPDKLDLALEMTKFGKECTEKLILDKTGYNIYQLQNYCVEHKMSYKESNIYYDFLKMESPFILESFIVHMEHKRPYTKQFYLPRKKTLKVVVDDLQEFYDTDLRFYGLSMPSRVGKSTICIFFLAWVMMRKPNSHNAMGGHSGILAKGFYKELLNLITTDEYTFFELYNYMHPTMECMRDKSSDEFTITLGDPDRFATFTARGIDGTWTGAVDISKDGILYVDDLVRDREHSLSPIRMENTWQEYLNKMVDRKNDGAKELMVGTLWNVLDPLEKMRQLYDGNPKYKFRRIPALNDDDESNFDYEVNGFSTEYYRDMRNRLDSAEWMAKYQQKPFVREGLLLPEDELRYFNGILPEEDHRVVAVCDVAFGGGDSLSMPIGAEYENGDVYIFDWVFSPSPKEVTVPVVAGKIMDNEIRQTRFEGNQGGDMYASYVDEALKKAGYKCNITTKKAPNNMEKISKIVAYSGDIKRRFIFLTPRKQTQEEMQEDAKYGIKRYTRSAEYQKAMDEVCSFVTIGKNVHDDAVDSLAQLEMFIENPTAIKIAQIIRSPI